MPIKAVLIDDERPALRGLEYMLKKYPEITVAGMYINPITAIHEIERIKPQVVFLDIHMPQLQGLDAVAMILDVSPDSDIIFVTAFDQYAIEAFELDALDYILKPIDRDRLAKTIERVMKKCRTVVCSDEKKLQIKSLGRLEVAFAGREPIRWHSKKTKELFAYLLQNAGRSILKDELMDSLWTYDDPERAVRHLYNGIYHVRKALCAYGIGRDLINIDGNYNLTLGNVDWDKKRFLAFENGPNTGSVEELETLIGLYTGEYLEGEDYSWANIEIEKMSSLYFRYCLRLAGLYMDDKTWEKAESCLRKAYRTDPFCEDATELLLKLYTRTGNKNKAVIHFTDYSDMIMKELGVMPSEKLMDLYRALCY